MSQNLIKKTSAEDVKQISSDYVLKQLKNIATLEKYALVNGSKGIKAIAHTNNVKVPVKVTVIGHKNLNGWYDRNFLKNLNLI
jgi:hypothetical protein